MDTDVVNKNMKIVPRGDQNGAQRRGTSGEGAQGPKMGSACESWESSFGDHFQPSGVPLVAKGT